MKIILRMSLLSVITNVCFLISLAVWVIEEDNGEGWRAKLSDFWECYITQLPGLCFDCLCCHGSTSEGESAHTHTHTHTLLCAWPPSEPAWGRRATALSTLLSNDRWEKKNKRESVMAEMWISMQMGQKNNRCGGVELNMKLPVI